MTTKKVTDSSFSDDVLGSDEPVLLDFWAEWCGPCKQIGPALEEISEEFAGKLTVAKLNIDENPETPGKYGVRGSPTLMMFHKGELVSTEVGAKPKSQIVAWINTMLSSAAAQA